MRQAPVRDDPHGRNHIVHEVFLVPGIVHGEDVAHPLAVAQHRLVAVVQVKQPAVAAVEVQLSAEANPFIDAAIESLDRRWRARVAAKTDQS